MPRDILLQRSFAAHQISQRLNKPCGDGKQKRLWGERNNQPSSSKAVVC